MKPALFGLKNTNRDFEKPLSWGKNIFNNAFPAALTCYLYAKSISPVYLTINQEGAIDIDEINVSVLFGADPFDTDVFYAFERDFTPYQTLVIGSLPRTDLVIIHEPTGTCIRALEIKLTALPDNSTFHLLDEFYGCEIVVRPDTIVYLALSIVALFRHNREQLRTFLNTELPVIRDWSDISEVSPLIPQMASAVEKVLRQNINLQQPLVLQPVWKTEGKLLRLHENAFDVFVWSNFAFTRLFFRSAYEVGGKPSRGARSIAWLTKMLFDFANEQGIHWQQTIDRMSFNTKNDKAFAVNGRVTQPYMKCEQLTTPRIRREEIRNIILGGGETFLSPERRLDAAILSTPDLFENL